MVRGPTYLKKAVHTHTGFFLVQMVVYLALLALITLFMMQWAASAAMQRAILTRKGDMALTLAAVSDVLVRDMRVAENILHHDATSCIWRAVPADVGWRAENNKLIRTEGRYGGGRWLDHSQSLMAQGVTDMKISFDHDERIARVVIMTQLPGNKDELFACERTVWRCDGLCS